MLDKFLLGETRDFKFATVAPSTGAPTTLAGTPVVSAYLDNGTTQITTGITLSVDFDSVTGMHNVRVVATAANGYDYGVKYTLVITTGTVDSVSAVGYTVGEFYVYPSIIPELGILDYGVAQSATATSLVLRAALSIPDDEMIGATILIISGTAGARARRLITGWVSSTDTASVDTWTTTPTGTIDYIIYASPVGSDALPSPIDKASFFTEDSGETYGSAVSGSVVKEIADNAGGSSAPTILQTTTIATLATQISFTLTAGSADDDAYNGCQAIITDASTSTQKAFARIADYVGSTRTVTLAVDPAIFTMAATDTISIVAPDGHMVDLTEDDGGGALRYTAKALEQVQAFGGGVLHGGYVFSNTTTEADPGSGGARINNAFYHLADEVYLSATTDSGFDASTSIEALRSGDRISLIDDSNGANFGSFTLLGAPVDNTGWYSIPVDPLANGGPITNGGPCEVYLAYASSDAAAVADAVLRELIGDHSAVSGSLADFVSRIGAPISVDSGTATLAGMITKIFDDNNGLTYDATNSSLNSLQATVSAGVPQAETADGQTINDATDVAGSYTDTYTNNGVYWQTSPDGVSPLDTELLFNVNGRQPSSLHINGRFDSSGSGHFVNIFAYNYTTLAFDQISDASTRMNQNSSDLDYPFNFTADHKDSTNGDMRIQFVSDDATASRDLFLDEVIVTSVGAGVTVDQVAEAVRLKMLEAIYPDGIWYDDIGGSAGSVVGTNGVAGAAVDNEADLLLLSAALNTKSAKLKPGSTLTLTTSYSNWRFDTVLGIIVQNGQQVDDSVFMRALVSGANTVSPGSLVVFEICGLVGISTGAASMINCGLAGTITFVDERDYQMSDCVKNLLLGSGTLVLDVAGDGVTPTNIVNDRFSGDAELQNLTSTDSYRTSGKGTLTINANCTGGTIQWAGDIKIVNNAGTAVTITHSNIGDMHDGIIIGEAATGTLSATQATTNLTGYTVSQLIGRTITWLSGTAEGEQSKIEAYVVAGGLLTFAAMTVAPANTDKFKIT